MKRKFPLLAHSPWYMEMQIKKLEDGQEWLDMEHDATFKALHARITALERRLDEIEGFERYPEVAAEVKKRMRKIRGK